ncbi:MAG: AI-2E family transporter [Actinobacteria bacterium]|nr:MAG: AI-2E family transporter [Actinomycetota bacterium]
MRSPSSTRTRAASPLHRAFLLREKPASAPQTPCPGPLRGQAAARARLTPVCRACNRGEDSTVGQVARKAAVATLVVVGIIALVLALWKLRVLVSLFFLGLVIAAAMRPGIEWLQARRVPRSVGLAVHYLVLAGVVALFLWLVVPRAVDQVGQALGGVPTSRNALDKATRNSTGIKHTILRALQKRLKKLPAASSLVHASVSVTKTAFEVLIAIFFTFAVAAYWIFERDRARRVVLSLVARERRKTIRDTWDLIDAKLGAFVRGQLVLIAFVGTVLSLAFWAIGVPFWLLLGIFAGVVEIIPIVGPLTAGGVAIGVGLTDSWQIALAAGLAVLVVRLVEDYIVVPKVLGHAVGLSPLVVLVSVTAIGLLLGGIYVLLAVPIAAVLVTLVDVIVRDKDPAEEEVPTLLFPAKDAEA